MRLLNGQSIWWIMFDFPFVYNGNIAVLRIQAYIYGLFHGDHRLITITVHTAFGEMF